MHIADGILALQETVLVSVASAGLFYLGLKKLDHDKVPLAAVCSAMFFIASFIHIPFGVTQIHLVLVGIIGLLLGISSFVPIFIALMLQALLLGYGGVSSIGVNLFIMAMPAIIVYYLYHRDFFQKLNDKLKFFLVGFLGVFFSTLFLTGTLFLSKQEYEFAAITIFAVNSIGMVVEGFVSMFLLLFLQKVYPQILK